MWLKQQMSSWYRVITFTTRVFILFFYVSMFFVDFFCECWWPISVRAYACVRIGQSVKLGLAWSHDITGLRGLLASQRLRLLLLLLLLLFLSPHKLLHSLLQVSGSAPFFSHSPLKTSFKAG